MPKDRVTGSHQNYGFVEFLGEEDAEYALKVCESSHCVYKYGNRFELTISSGVADSQRHQPLRQAHPRQQGLGQQKRAGRRRQHLRQRPGAFRFVNSMRNSTRPHLHSFLQAAEVDEKLLHDTFSAFGVLLRPPKLMRGTPVVVIFEMQYF